jgi:cysteine-rich repeat protein
MLWLALGGLLILGANSRTPAGTPGGGSCGDGTVNAGEQCDDGNTIDGDGCSSLCRIEGLQ